MVLIKRRTWKDTAWPDATLTSSENPEATKADSLVLRQVFDVILLAVNEFGGSVEQQASRFCDVPKRGCRGVPENPMSQRNLYDSERKQFAILDRTWGVTGGYLYSWKKVKRVLAKQKIDILDLDDDSRPGSMIELTKPFFIDHRASQVRIMRMSLA